jgi:putative tributyrin esterase
MIWQHNSFFSQTLKRTHEFYTFLPQTPVPETGWPLLLLIHGLGGSYESWQRYTSVERYAEAYKVAVICPDASRSFYGNNAYGRYWDFFKYEFWEIINSLYKISGKREEVAVCGLSMGGFGALKLGFNLPERFGTVASLSGIGDMKNFRLTNEAERYYFLDNELQTLFPDKPEVDAADDIAALAAALAPDQRLRPKLYISCGTEDFLITAHRQFSAYLNKIGYSHMARESRGKHNWYYWDREIIWLFKNFFKYERIDGADAEEGEEE